VVVRVSGCNVESPNFDKLPTSIAKGHWWLREVGLLLFRSGTPGANRSQDKKEEKNRENDRNVVLLH
jgi:hypothetical protein